MKSSLDYLRVYIIFSTLMFRMVLLLVVLFFFFLIAFFFFRMETIELDRRLGALGPEDCLRFTPESKNLLKKLFAAYGIIAFSMYMFQDHLVTTYIKKKKTQRRGLVKKKWISI